MKKRAKIRTTFTSTMEVVDAAEKILNTSEVESYVDIQIDTIELEQYAGNLSDLIQMKMDKTVYSKIFVGAALEFASIWRQS